jgi:SET domain-containing protein
MTHTQSKLIKAKKIPNKGRGVFAVKKIKKGTEFERVPVIILPPQDVFGTTRTSKLADYVFEWNDDQMALALGYGSLYNHSFRPNSQYLMEDDDTQVYVALRDIEAGEEITINYNSDPKSTTEVAFEVVDD